MPPPLLAQPYDGRDWDRTSDLPRVKKVARCPSGLRVPRIPMVERE
jgi:hypothetical protein